jgi:type IV secretory pathway VirB3-like protein
LSFSISILRPLLESTVGLYRCYSSILNSIYLRPISFHFLVFFLVLVLILFLVLFLFLCLVPIFPSWKLQAVVILEEVQIFDLWFKTNRLETTFDSLENVSTRGQRMESFSILHP